MGSQGGRPGSVRAHASRGSDKLRSASPLTQQPPQGCKARGLCCGEQRAELLRGGTGSTRRRDLPGTAAPGHRHQPVLPLLPPAHFCSPPVPPRQPLRPVQASACGRASSPLPERERLHPAWPGQCCSVIS